MPHGLRTSNHWWLLRGRHGARVQPTLSVLPSQFGDLLMGERWH